MLLSDPSRAGRAAGLASDGHARRRTRGHGRLAAVAGRPRPGRVGTTDDARTCRSPCPNIGRSRARSRARGRGLRLRLLGRSVREPFRGGVRCRCRRPPRRRLRLRHRRHPPRPAGARGRGRTISWPSRTSPSSARSTRCATSAPSRCSSTPSAGPGTSTRPAGRRAGSAGGARASSCPRSSRSSTLSVSQPSCSRCSRPVIGTASPVLEDAAESLGATWTVPDRHGRSVERHTGTLGPGRRVLVQRQQDRHHRRRRHAGHRRRRPGRPRPAPVHPGQGARASATCTTRSATTTG